MVVLYCRLVLSESVVSIAPALKEFGILSVLFNDRVVQIDSFLIILRLKRLGCSLHIVAEHRRFVHLHSYKDQECGDKRQHYDRYRHFLLFAGTSVNEVQQFLFVCDSSWHSLPFLLLPFIFFIRRSVLRLWDYISYLHKL